MTTNVVSKAMTAKGSNAIRWNISEAATGKPVGQIWTFRCKGEIHMYHLLLLNGFYAVFESLKSAKAFAEI